VPASLVRHLLDLSGRNTKEPDKRRGPKQKDSTKSNIQTSKGEMKSTMERPLQVEIRVKSLAIKAAREVIKLIDPELIRNYDELLIPMTNQELLQDLLESGFVDQEGYDKQVIDVVGLSAAMVIGAKDKSGRNYLIAGAGKKNHKKVFESAVIEQLSDHIRRLDVVRRGSLAK
jgi:hypothetical protein